MDRKNFIFKPGLANDGKPIIDFRTIPLKAILNYDKLPPLKAECNAQEEAGGLTDNRMFGNDKHGDCVIAAQAHHTLVFERFEQDKLIYITDEEVIQEYYRQSSGIDAGLFLTSAMKEWRNTGWTAAGKHHNIYAFAGAEPIDHVQIKYSIQLLRGIIFGMYIYSTDIDQFRKGEKWHLTGHDGTFEGGHGVYGFKFSSKYNSMGCLTWANEQSMDWDFWDKRVNQAFAIVDNKNEWMVDTSPLNIEETSRWLKLITGETHKVCPLCKVIRRLHGVLS